MTIWEDIHATKGCVLPDEVVIRWEKAVSSLGGCSHVVPSSHLPLLLWTLWDKNHHWGQGGGSHMILIEILHCRLFLSPTLCSGAAFLSSPYYPSCRWDILKEKYLKCWNQGACGRFLRVHGLHKSVRADWHQETVRFPSRWLLNLKFSILS